MNENDCRFKIAILGLCAGDRQRGDRGAKRQDLYDFEHLLSPNVAVPMRGECVGLRPQTILREMRPSTAEG